MIYGTISQGFLSGAFNDELNALLVPELTPLLTYQPEFVTNYELGFKGTLADGPGAAIDGHLLHGLHGQAGSY